MKITAEFVTSAAGADGFPGDRLPEIALVGRSNVGKSSLINALTRHRVARTSAAPGKTRLANIYRVARGDGPPLYLVDLPGYGYARGGASAAREFEELARAYFSDARGRKSTLEAEEQRSRDKAWGWGPAQVNKSGAPPSVERRLRPCRAEDERIRGEASAKARGGGGAPPPVEKELAALLLVDARHPGLESDRDAWHWLRDTVADSAIVATKIDKLARGERIRALRELESVFEHSVLPVSAVTAEGLDELWKLIDRLANSRNPQPPRWNNRNSSPNNLPGATAPPAATRARPPRKK